MSVKSVYFAKLSGIDLPGGIPKSMRYVFTVHPWEPWGKAPGRGVTRCAIHGLMQSCCAHTLGCGGEAKNQYQAVARPKGTSNRSIEPSRWCLRPYGPNQGLPVGWSASVCRMRETDRYLPVAWRTCLYTGPARHSSEEATLEAPGSAAGLPGRHAEA